MSGNFKLKYYPQLDGLRGVAILLVMLFHAKFPFFGGGYIGVDIFFVLSGFLITSLLIKEFNDTERINLKKFYIRRMRRLFPALFFFLLIYLIFSWCLLNYNGFYENFIDSIIALFYMTNWGQALGYRESSLLNHTWSLSVEEQFYLVFPIFMYFLLKMGMRKIYIFSILIFISLLSWGLKNLLLEPSHTVLIGLYMRLDTRLDALMIGCSLTIILSYFNGIQKIEIKKLISLLMYLSVIYLGFIVYAMKWLDIEMFILHFYLVALAVSILIYNTLINQESMFSRLLQNEFLVYIGKLSYGLYLWHYPIFVILRKDNSPWFVMVIGGGLSLLLACISYYFIEQKFHYRNFKHDMN